MSIESALLRMCKARFGDNLAGLAIYGSYNTGSYAKGESDIDTLIYLLSYEGIDLAEEKNTLEKEGESIKLSVQQLATVAEAEERIYKEGIWSTWITLIAGSKKVYSTPEFDSFIARLKGKRLNPKRVSEYLLKKEKIEIEGYIPTLLGWDFTKSIYSHLRRKLQIISYSSSRMPEFDFQKCLQNSKIYGQDAEDLNNIHGMYIRREKMNENGKRTYLDLSKKLMKLALTALNGTDN